LGINIVIMIAEVGKMHRSLLLLVVFLASALLPSTAHRSLRHRSPSSHLIAEVQGSRTEDLGPLSTGPFIPYRDSLLPARAAGPFYPTAVNFEEEASDGGRAVLSAEVLPVKIQHNLLGGNLLVEAEKPRGRAVAMKAPSRLWGGERAGGGVVSLNTDLNIPRGFYKPNHTQGASNIYRLPSGSGSESFASAIKKILMGIH